MDSQEEEEEEEGENEEMGGGGRGAVVEWTHNRTAGSSYGSQYREQPAVCMPTADGRPDHKKERPPTH